jgi:hypothetical protein
MTGPQPYDERRRLADLIGDARKALADDSYGSERAGLAARCGQLEALLQMTCDGAERAVAGPEAGR